MRRRPNNACDLSLMQHWAQEHGNWQQQSVLAALPKGCQWWKSPSWPTSPSFILHTVSPSLVQTWEHGQKDWKVSCTDGEFIVLCMQGKVGQCNTSVVTAGAPEAGLLLAEALSSFLDGCFFCSLPCLISSSRELPC